MLKPKNLRIKVICCIGLQCCVLPNSGMSQGYSSDTASESLEVTVSLSENIQATTNYDNEIRELVTEL